jgi:outer membrane receptor protein involved in Fe transport
VTNPAPSAVRSAGLALPNLTTGTRFAEPEDTTVVEVGLKGNWETFRFNLAIFEQSIKGFQSNVFVGTGFVLGNAEKQSTKGFEIESSWDPTPNLNLTAALTYLDPKYDKFTGGTAFNPVTRNTGPANLTGQRPSGIAEYSYTLGVTYSAPIGGNRELVFHTDYNKQKPCIVAQGLPNETRPEVLNASVALDMGNGLELSVWGRNLTEPEYNTTIFPGVAQSGTLSGYPNAPATYGASARFRF